MKTLAQERRAIDERNANAAAKDAGKPLPYANRWDALMSKLPADASPEAGMQWHRDFAKRYAPKKRAS